MWLAANSVDDLPYFLLETFSTTIFNGLDILINLTACLGGMSENRQERIMGMKEEEKDPSTAHATSTEHQKHLRLAQSTLQRDQTRHIIRD